MMQIVDDDVMIHEEELQEIGMMLDFLLAELLSMKNFQFIQALLQLFLKVCEWTPVKSTLDFFVMLFGPVVFFV